MSSHCWIKYILAAREREWVEIRSWKQPSSVFPLLDSHPRANNCVQDPSWQIEMADQVLLSWRNANCLIFKRNTQKYWRKKFVEKENGESYRKLYKKGWISYLVVLSPWPFILVKKNFTVYGQCWVSFLFGLKCNLQHPCCSVILESDYPEHQNLVTIKNKMSVTKKLKISLVPSLRLMTFIYRFHSSCQGELLPKGSREGVILFVISSVGPQGVLLVLGVLEELLLGTRGGGGAQIGMFPSIWSVLILFLQSVRSLWSLPAISKSE